MIPMQIDHAASTHHSNLALSSASWLQPDHGYPSRFLGRAQQAAALADLAERCASEARSLGGDAAAGGQQLAEQFDKVAAQLASSAR